MKNSTSLYIHIPFCKKKCDYCDFYSVGEKDRIGKDNNLSDSYVLALVNEIHHYALFYKIDEWATVYVGGGTPSILSSRQLKILFDGIKDAAPFSTDAEITLEMNPDDVTEKFIECASTCGVNRLSLGIQALDDDALRSVSRACNVETVINALEILRSKWNDRLSVDFIAGLPGQTYSSFKNQFEILDEYQKIDHVSLYTLTVEEHTPLWKNINDGKIKFSFEKADRMWILGRNILKKKGFFQYEVSNFSKKGFESRHNMTYWKSNSYIGCGSGACGTWNEKNHALRWTNTLSIPSYVNFWSNSLGQKKLPPQEKLPRKCEELDLKTLEFEFLMMGFRTFFGVSEKEYGERFGKSLSERLGVKDGLYASWKKRRLVRSCKKDGEIFYSLNERGILLLNRFLEELL